MVPGSGAPDKRGVPSPYANSKNSYGIGSGVVGMTRRIVQAVLLSLLVVLAGCSALGGGDGDGATNTTPAADPGGEPAGSGDVVLVENRTAALEAAGGYTGVWQMESSRDGELVGRTTYTHAVDYENERSSFTMVMASEGEVSNDYESFHADGVSYTRYGAGEEATYQTNDAAFAPGNTLFSVQSYVTDADDLSEFAAVGTESYDGVTVTRYERTDRPTWVSAQGSGGEFTWTEFTYTVLVDENGLVRSESWGGEGVDADGVSQTIAFSYSLTDVGSTVVEEPDWITAAQAQTEQ